MCPSCQGFLVKWQPDSEPDVSTKHIDTCIDSGHIQVVTFWNKVNPIVIS